MGIVYSKHIQEVEIKTFYQRKGSPEQYGEDLQQRIGNSRSFAYLIVMQYEVPKEIWTQNPDINVLY